MSGISLVPTQWPSCIQMFWRYLQGKLQTLVHMLWLKLEWLRGSNTFLFLNSDVPEVELKFHREIMFTWWHVWSAVMAHMYHGIVQKMLRLDNYWPTTQFVWLVANAQTHADSTGTVKLARPHWDSTYCPRKPIFFNLQPQHNNHSLFNTKHYIHAILTASLLHSPPRVCCDETLAQLFHS